jgi:hypothetical protein
MAMLWLTQPCHRFLRGRSSCDARVQRPCPYFVWRKRFTHAAAPILTEKRGAVHNRSFVHCHGKRVGSSCPRASHPRSALSARPPGSVLRHTGLACRWCAAQTPTRAWRQLRPCGRTRGPRGMLSPGEPGATLQGRTAGAVPRASEAGGPSWPRRMTHAHDGTGGR